MSIRSRVRGRALPTEVVPFPADRAEFGAAHEALSSAAAAVAEAERGGDAPAELLEAERAAQARVDALEVHSYTVRALEPKEWERLIGEHPAQRDGDQENGFHPETFWPAVLAESVTLAVGDAAESSTAQEWDEMFEAGEFSAAEKYMLTNTCWRLNVYAAVVPPSVGKDSGPTRP